MNLRVKELILCSLILIIAAAPTAAATPISIKIGDTTVESRDDSGSDNWLTAQKATLGHTATIQSLSLYVNGPPHGKLRLGLYDDNAGSPGALIASTDEFTPTSTGWNTQNVVSPVSLPAGTYWLAYLPQSGFLGVRASNDGSSGAAFSFWVRFNYGPLPATFPSASGGGAHQWSLYATLNTESGPIAELAEKTPPVDSVETQDSSDPPTTTTTTTTTTTLPTIPRCPDGIADAQTGSQSGYNYWSFDDETVCGHQGMASTIYCFENPWVDVSRSDLRDWDDNPDTGPAFKGVAWNDFAAEILGTAAEHPEICYLCGCIRTEGCFAPGVKIAMADGSLRNIEDVRAGDLVRNAKTGAPVKVSKVIEGPEALPLIRFGFEGTTVTTSQAHPVLTATGLKPANQLKKGDTVFDAQGHPHALTILETLPIEEGQRVVNVDLATAPSDTNDRLLISDGIITGDIVLQGLLKDQK